MAVAILAAGQVAEAGREAKIAAHKETNSSLIRSAVEDYLADELDSRQVEWDLKEIIIPSAKRIPSDFDRLEVEKRRSGRRGKSLGLLIKFYDNGRIIKKLNITCKVDIVAEVVVAKTRIRRGSMLTSDMLTLEKREIFLPISDLSTDIANTIGQIAQRNIRSGMPVAKTDLARPPDVLAGDIVMIVAENSNIRITAKGIAKKDGQIGEVIPLVNLRSNRKIYGRVIASSTVQVNF